MKITEFTVNLKDNRIWLLLTDDDFNYYEFAISESSFEILQSDAKIIINIKLFNYLKSGLEILKLAGITLLEFKKMWKNDFYLINKHIKLNENELICKKDDSQISNESHAVLRFHENLITIIKNNLKRL